MRLLILLLLSVVFLVACKKEAEPVVSPGTLTVSSNAINLSGSVGATDTITIRTRSSWSITASPNGIVSLSSTSGSGDARVGITVVQENTSAMPRTVNLSVTAGGQSQNIVINQQAAVPGKTTPLSDFLFGGAGLEAILQSVYAADSGMLHVGYTTTIDGIIQSRGGNDILVVRTDKEGKLVWLKTFGTFQDDEAFSCVRVGDNYFISGSVSGSGGDFTAGTSPDAFLMKINDRGEVLFNKRIETPGGRDGAYKVILSSDNRILVGGARVETGRSDQNFWFAAFSQDGELLVNKHYGTLVNDFAADIVEAPDKSIYMVGSVGAGGLNDMVLMKLSSAGDSLWSRIIRGTGTDDGIAVVVMPDGSVVMGGSSDSRDLTTTAVPGASNGWLIRFSSQGDELWRVPVGGEGDDYIWNLYPLANGKIIGCGTTRSSFPGVQSKGTPDGWIFQADAATGVIEWHGQAGGAGEDAAFSVIPYRNGYYLSGYSYSTNFNMMPNKGFSDAWLSVFTRL